MTFAEAVAVLQDCPPVTRKIRYPELGKGYFYADDIGALCYFNALSKINKRGYILTLEEILRNDWVVD